MGFDDWSFDNGNDIEGFEDEFGEGFEDEFGEGFEDEFGNDFGELNNNDYYSDNNTLNVDELEFNKFDSEDDDDIEPGGVGKSGIILVIAGIIIIAIVGFIASKLVSKTEGPTEDNVGIENSIELDNNDYPTENKKAVVETESPENRHESNNNVSYNEKENTEEWVEITASEVIDIPENYIESLYTVTKIEHIARKSDSNGNLEIKTKLKGSISGLGGTYEITLPYNKGIKIRLRDQFKIEVLVGEYKDKIVLLDVKF